MHKRSISRNKSFDTPFFLFPFCSSSEKNDVDFFFSCQDFFFGNWRKCSFAIIARKTSHTFVQFHVRILTISRNEYFAKSVKIKRFNRWYSSSRSCSFLQQTRSFGFSHICIPIFRNEYYYAHYSFVSRPTKRRKKKCFSVKIMHIFGQKCLKSSQNSISSPLIITDVNV